MIIYILFIFSLSGAPIDAELYLDKEQCIERSAVVNAGQKFHSFCRKN
jgi:hypothetical protein